MQQNPHYLSIIAWLQQHYITTFLGDVVNYPTTIKYRKNPALYLSKSRKYFKANRSRVKDVMHFLQDEKSKKAYYVAIKYRTDRRRIRHDEWTLTDQYFVKDIIQIGDNEVKMHLIFR